MICFYCKGRTFFSITTYIARYQDFTMAINNVPCEKCSQCGEEYLNGKTLEKIEKIIQRMP